jgi:stearoyl-CoA desaturase (delta-9 desaturase)
LYLHRTQAHLALDLHPVVSHFFRFWLWLTTGIITKEWVAVHRKHHARVETADDPHSPKIQGIEKVLFLGAWLYHKEAANLETLAKFGHGSPNDWIERHLYARHSYLGVLIMLLVNLIVFGLPGLLIWMTQMLWIPFWAAGVINGIGHHWGYRNYEVPDASKNIVPWGLVIGGEELHNNHHAYASSAKFSSKPWEVDLGWGYIRLLSMLGLAKVKKTAPKIVVNKEKSVFDLETVKAVINNRFGVMANFIKEVLNDVCTEELRKLERKNQEYSLIKRARRLMSRESSLLSEKSRTQLQRVLEMNANLNQVYAMKQRLQEIWSKSAVTQENLLNALEEWCRAAESSGIEALREFSRRLRRYELASA